MAWERGYGQLFFIPLPLLTRPTQRYRGVSQTYVSPFDLASSDIVLVTYETLRKEINHANSHEGETQEAFGDPPQSVYVFDLLQLVSRVLRHRKRYTCYPSPLPAVKWWRVSICTCVLALF